MIQEDRTAKLARLKDATKEKDDLDKQLRTQSHLDPVFLKSLDAETTVAVEAANRWTDNIQAIQKYAFDLLI